MTTLYPHCAPTLLFAARLGDDTAGPPALELRKEVLAELRRMVDRCRTAGVPDAETAEARYAIVAFVDDRILHSTWPGRTEWMREPLQLQLYREYAAGENFFARLAALLRRREPSLAIEIYYLCLALGFVGASRDKGTGRELEAHLDAARARLPRPAEGPLCPRAIPAGARAPKPERPRVALHVAACCTLVVFMGLWLLDWSLQRMVARAESRLREASAQVSQAPVSP